VLRGERMAPAAFSSVIVIKNYRMIIENSSEEL
jgi:hypothetical protein